MGKKGHSSRLSKRTMLKRIRLTLSAIGFILSFLIIVSAAAFFYRPVQHLPRPESQVTKQTEVVQPSLTLKESESVNDMGSSETTTGASEEAATEQIIPATMETYAPLAKTGTGGQEWSTSECDESSDGTVILSTETAPELESTTEITVRAEPPAWTLPTLIIGLFLLAMDIVAITVCSREIRRNERRKAPRMEEKRVEPIARTVFSGVKPAQAITIGQLHNIGARPYQEDSSGVVSLNDGVFAVVADGMGGLSGGDKVSQKIVYTMLEFSNSLRPGQMDGALEQMLNSVNNAINCMLGESGLQKSGSTLMAVLARNNQFHWIAVGDSHIYLFHEGSLTQLNQEHNRGQELLRRAITGQLSFDEVRADPKKSGLTSYIGMGTLMYVEKSLFSIPLQRGDRILLTTDGVFNALSDEQICTILKQTPDVAEAAQVMERSVIARDAAHQDNFTAVILGF